MKPRCIMLGAHKGDEVPYQGIFDYTTLDIEPKHNPDIVADATSLPFETESIEAIFASHLLEHLSVRRYGNVLKEWYRVLKPGGELLVIVPNLAKAAEQILIDPERVLYVAPAGPITALDMMLGLECDSTAMYHRWGFTRDSLAVRAKELEWSEGGVWEGRSANPYDRCELRLYARKPGDHPWQGWDLKLLNTGDKYMIHLGVNYGR